MAATDKAPVSRPARQLNVAEGRWAAEDQISGELQVEPEPSAHLKPAAE